MNHLCLNKTLNNIRFSVLDQYEAESQFKIQASSPSGINACSTFLVYVGKLSKQTEITLPHDNNTSNSLSHAAFD